MIVEFFAFAYRHPESAVIMKTSVIKTRKTWESLLFAYPIVQAFALPLYQDKQHELAHAMLLYINPHFDLFEMQTGIINLTRTFRLRIFW